MCSPPASVTSASLIGRSLRRRGIELQVVSLFTTSPCSTLLVRGQFTRSSRSRMFFGSTFTDFSKVPRSLYASSRSAVLRVSTGPKAMRVTDGFTFSIHLHVLSKKLLKVSSSGPTEGSCISSPFPISAAVRIRSKREALVLMCITPVGTAPLRRLPPGTTWRVPASSWPVTMVQSLSEIGYGSLRKRDRRATSTPQSRLIGAPTDQFNRQDITKTVNTEQEAL